MQVMDMANSEQKYDVPIREGFTGVSKPKIPLVAFFV
jgi:hypothetical protein